MNASLVMFKADGTRRDFPLREGSLVIGRKNSCELRIPLSSVSRQHCEITIENDEIKLKDLGSSNGTYHNNIRVQAATLTAGDEVVVGPVVFTLTVNGLPADIQPVRTILTGSANSHDSGATAAPPPSTEATEAEVTTTLDDVDSPSLADDDDPIAALEAMAGKENAGGSGDSSLGDFDFDFDELTSED